MVPPAGGGTLRCMTDYPFPAITLDDGRRLCFDDTGSADGPPVLYFHGAGASALARPPFEAGDDLAGVRLIAVERPGIGGSDPQPHRRLADWPGDVVQLADHLGIDRFAVVGWSAGGPHALACAAALSDRVTACGVFGGAVAIGWPGWQDGVADELVPFCELAVSSPDDLRSILGPMTADPEAFALTFLEHDPSAAALLADQRVRHQVRADARRAFAQGPDAMLRDCALIYSAWDFDLTTTAVPVQLVYGREDRTCPVTWGEHLATLLPTAEVVVLDGVGHNHGYDLDVFRELLTRTVMAAGLAS